MLQRFRSKVIEKSNIDTNVVLFKLELTEPFELEFIAGQYVLFNIPKEDGEIALRHLSIASPPADKKQLEFVAKLIHRGLASTFIENLKIGNEVIFSGPAGLFKFHHSEKDKIFVATGTGIAPIRSILESILNPNDQIPSSNQIPNSKLQLFWGLRHWKDVYFFEEFKKLSAENPNFQFKICLSQEKDLSNISKRDREYFELGRVNPVIENSLKIDELKIENSDVFICGDRKIVDSLRKFLSTKGVSSEQIHFEKF